MAPALLHIVVTLILFTVIGCGSKEITVMEYKDWASSAESGYVLTDSSSSFGLKVFYRPSLYMAFESCKWCVDSTAFKNAKFYDGQIYFLVQITSLKGRKDPISLYRSDTTAYGQKMTDVYSTFKHALRIVSHGDTIPALSMEMEPSNNTKLSQDFLFVFNRPSNLDFSKFKLLFKSLPFGFSEKSYQFNSTQVSYIPTIVL